MFFVFFMFSWFFYKVFSLIILQEKYASPFQNVLDIPFPLSFTINSSYHYFTIYIMLHFLKIPNDEIKNIHPYLFDSTLWPTISDENISIYSLNSNFRYFDLMLPWFHGKNRWSPESKGLKKLRELWGCASTFDYLRVNFYIIIFS